MAETITKYEALPIPGTEYFIVKSSKHGIIGVFTRSPDKIFKTRPIEIPHFSGVIRKYYFFENYDHSFLTQVN